MNILENAIKFHIDFLISQLRVKLDELLNFSAIGLFKPISRMVTIVNEVGLISQCSFIDKLLGTLEGAR